jgi:HrpA-like RNA helicase
LRTPTAALAAAAEIVAEIHVNEPPTDHVLVFCSGQDEIDNVCRMIHERIMRERERGVAIPGLRMCPLHSMLPTEFYARAFEPVPEDTRKVVVATNIAETSVTVDGVKFVIDNGYVKQKQFDPLSGMDALQLVPISKVGATQRMGRAGRTGAGICFRLYTKDKYDEFDDVVAPEILRTNVANVVLMLKAMGIGDIIAYGHIIKQVSLEQV